MVIFIGVPVFYAFPSSFSLESHTPFCPPSFLWYKHVRTNVVATTVLQSVCQELGAVKNRNSNCVFLL